VVGFEDQHIGAAHPFQDQPGGVSQVRDIADFAPWCPQQEPDRVLGVMRDAERVDFEIGNLEAAARAEEPPIQFEAELESDFLLGAAVAVDGICSFWPSWASPWI